MATLNLAQFPGGDLKGQTIIDAVIDGYKGPPITLTNGTLVNASVLNSADITFDGVTIKGDNGTTPVPQIGKKGLFIRDSKRVTVRNSDISRSFVGVDSYMSTDTTIDTNNFHDNRDHFHGVAADGLSVTFNAFHDNHNAPGDHPDAIQCFDGGVGRPIRNVTIRDNIYYRGAGNASQGIFLQQAYENLTVENNIVVGGMGNGIRIDKVVSGTVSNNEVVSYEKEKSALDIGGSPTLSGNLTTIYKVGGVFQKTWPTGVAKNAAIAPSEEAAIVAAWHQRAFSAPAPVPVPNPTPVPAPTPVEETPPVSDPSPTPEPIPAPVEETPAPVEEAPVEPPAGDPAPVETVLIPRGELIAWRDWINKLLG